MIAQLELTLYSRDELTLAHEPCNDDLERARRFIVRVCQSFCGRLESVGWGYTVTNPKTQVLNVWLNKIKHLAVIVERLKHIQIESKPALNVIKRFDTPNTLFYCDPPYVHSARVSKNDYGCYEMNDQDHQELSNVLHDCKGKVAISGYRCDLYDNLYKDWFRHDRNTTAYTTTARAKTYPKRIESLWTNYEVSS